MKQIQLTIKKEHDQGYSYSNLKHCPLANAVRPYFPGADISVAVSEIYDTRSQQTVGKIDAPGFTLTDFVDLNEYGKEFTTTLFIYGWWDKMKGRISNLFSK